MNLCTAFRETWPCSSDNSSLDNISLRKTDKVRT